MDIGSEVTDPKEAFKAPLMVALGSHRLIGPKQIEYFLVTPPQPITFEGVDKFDTNRQISNLTEVTFDNLEGEILYVAVLNADTGDMLAFDGMRDTEVFERGSSLTYRVNDLIITLD